MVQVEQMGLDFTVTEENFGQVRTVPLVPGGGDVEVDGSNRLEYDSLRVRPDIRGLLTCVLASDTSS